MRSQDGSAAVADVSDEFLTHGGERGFEFDDGGIGDEDCGGGVVCEVGRGILGTGCAFDGCFGGYGVD